MIRVLCLITYNIKFTHESNDTNGIINVRILRKYFDRDAKFVCEFILNINLSEIFMGNQCTGFIKVYKLVKVYDVNTIYEIDKIQNDLIIIHGKTLAFSCFLLHFFFRS